MKKSLFMLALGLTIATSMVAGTMAVYTHTDTILANANNEGITGTAKTFYIGAKTTKTLNDFSLAPGESVDWGFEVTNVDKAGAISEVNTDVIVSANVGTIQQWADLEVTLMNKGVVVGTSRPVDGKVTFTDSKAMKGTIDSTTDYTLTFKWLDVDGNDTLDNAGDTALVMDANGIKKDVPKVGNIKVTVTGTQSK